MTRHGKGRPGMAHAGYTNYRRKKKGLGVGGSGGSTNKVRRVWYEQGAGSDARKVDRPLPNRTLPTPG